MKKTLILLSTILMVTLTGCASINDQMLQKSRITENSNYKEYRDYSETDKLDQNGYYSEVTASKKKGSIHVTFASSNYLDVNYFKDAELTSKIDTDECYLDPGDHVYASVTVSKTATSSTYGFSEFRIYGYDDGNRELLSNSESGENGLAFMIPADFFGTELSVEPVGEYQKRVIPLTDFYSDDDGSTHNLPGTWYIDDKKCTDEKIEISPVASYIISYEYGSDEYFYMSSSPECYYNDNESGLIIFQQRDATDATVDYSVELHKYISVLLVSAMERTVTVNNGTEQTIKANGELEIPKLKYGDKVTFITNKEWSDLESCRALILTSSQDTGGYFQYNLTVPEKDGEFVFDPSEYSYQHGTIIFKCFGEIVTDTQYLAKGSKIKYEQGTAEDGYWLTSGEHVIIVGEENKTKQQLNSIHFTPKVQIIVKLVQPEYGGTISYYVDGKKISSEEYSTYSGTVISMNFDAWEGWICNATDGVEYQVDETKAPTITVNNKSVNEVFTEDDAHKPTLEVVLVKSVGENMIINLSASGLPSMDYKYKSDWVGSDYPMIKNKPIGTEQGITLSMTNRAIQSGTAVKILIEKEDTKKNKSSEIRYVQDLTMLQDPIKIYESDEIATSEIWYKSIKIVISVVEVETFIPFSLSNASIVVQNADMLATLKQGDILEGSQNVSVTITPADGYYIFGRNVSNDTYQNTMSFSKYLSGIQDIVQKHPAMKIYSATLDSSDPYGTCIYMLEGDSVSGTVKLRDGQKLTLEYEITDSSYIIENASGIGPWKNNKKTTGSIEVTAALDGKTIQREDFNISVVRGG